jgi:hypothetical protein
MGEGVSRRRIRREVEEYTFVDAPEITGDAFTEVADYGFEIWESAVK